MSKSSRAASRLGWVLLGAVVALGCMTVGDHNVRIKGERALIIWDAEKKVEHFIRWANFRNAKKSFGFIVPSPSVPQLETIDPLVFSVLPPLTDAVKEEHDRIVRSGAPQAGAKSVEVLQTKQVGGYDSVTVRATDGSTLDTWLTKNKFDRPPQFESWAKSYIDRGWVFTAFKLMPQASEAQLEPIRMTFDALEPFYPYREPAVPKLDEEDRDFELYFLAKQPFAPIMARKPWTSTATRIRDLGPSQATIEQQLRLPTGSLTGYTGMRYSLTSKARNGIDDIVFVKADAFPEDVTSQAAARWAGILIGVPLGFVAYRLLKRRSP